MEQKPQKTIHDIFAEYFDDTLIQKAAFQVSKKLEEGHICLDLKMYNSGNNDLLDGQKLLESPFVSEQIEDIQPFVLFNNKLYLHRYFTYESIILDKIQELILEGNINKVERIKELKENRFYISNLFNQKIDNKLPNELKIPWQLIAALNVLINNFSIITGGPGTGKTTTIAKILAIIFKLYPNTTVALAAPTGKAAARLNESMMNIGKLFENVPDVSIEKISELKAQTIHRLLGVQYHSNSFLINKDNPLNYDIVIIDESSMIDASLMAKLLESIKSKSKLILLGDKNQLSSIEAGSIFGDLCKSKSKDSYFSNEYSDFYNYFIDSEDLKLKIISNKENTNLVEDNIIELKRSFRFKPTEGIGKFSNLIIEGISDTQIIAEPFRHCNADQECVRISNDYNDLGFIRMLDLFEEYLKEKDIRTAHYKLNNIKILCAVREGEFGVNYYNNLVEKHLEKKGLIKPNKEFYNGQAIMITSNDYSLGLFNGDVGIIKLDPKSNSKRVYFLIEDKIIDYPIISINSFETVYAMTIHKSQGSEFENIVVILPNDSTHQLLSRELLYTAVTRAKKQVLILGSDEVLTNAINKKMMRVSGIQERISKIENN